MLITYLCFSPGGLIGKTKWGNKTTTETSEHSPGIEGSALHTYIRGNDLITTVWLNILPKDMIKGLPEMKFGRPVWESSAINRGDVSETEKHTKSYLGRLVPFSRAISLNRDKLSITLANGLSFPKLPEQRETSATVVRRGKGSKEKDFYIPLDLSRHPWRELSSVLSLKTAQLSGGALALKHIPFIKTEMVDIWTGGLAANKGKILDVGEWNFSLPLVMFGSSELLLYEAGVELARKGEYHLKNAVKTWSTDMKVDPKQVSYARAQTHYWSELDNIYQVLIETAQEKGSLNDKWYGRVRQAMEKSFAHSCSHTTPRQIRAFTRGQQQLWLKKTDE